MWRYEGRRAKDFPSTQKPSGGRVRDPPREPTGADKNGSVIGPLLLPRPPPQRDPRMRHSRGSRTLRSLPQLSRLPGQNIKKSFNP